MLTTVKQFPDTVGLCKVPPTRKPNCAQLFSADPASRVFLCRAFLLFWLTCE